MVRCRRVINCSILIILLLLGLVYSSSAQTNDGGNATNEGGLVTGASAEQQRKKIEIPEEVSSRCADFFKNIMTGNTEPAFKRLLVNSPIGEKREQLKRLTEQANRATDIYGTMKGFERVTSEFASPSYLRVRYIALHESYPMRWVFTLYKSPVKGWIVTNVKFDDDTDYLFSQD